MAVIQDKSKPWNWLFSWHETKPDEVIERSVHGIWGIQCCCSNPPAFMDGHINANLLPSRGLWIMLFACWQWGSNTGVNWATTVYIWWELVRQGLVYYLQPPGRREKEYLCHLQTRRTWFVWVLNMITSSCVSKHGGWCWGSVAEAKLGGSGNVAWGMEGMERRGKE